MYDYVSLIDGINRCAKEYKENCNKRDIITKIRKNLFIYTYFMILDKTKEEDMASQFYLSCIEPRIEYMLDRYDTSKGTFINYFNSYCYTSFSFYKLSNTTKSEKIVKALTQNGEFNPESRNEYRNEYNYSFEEKSLTASDIQEVYKLSNKVDENSGYHKRKIGSKDAIGILVYLLRYVYFVDKSTIQNISLFLNYGEEYIQKIVNQAISIVENNMERILYHRDKRNIYYSFLNLLIKKQKNEELMYEDKKLIQRYSSLKNKHARKLELLCLLPHEDIANILNIEYSKVRGLLHGAKKRMEKMKIQMDKFSK